MTQFFLLASLFLSLTAVAAPSAVGPKEAREIAIEAYLYGYSLITTEVTRIQMTNVTKIGELTAPMGHFINVKKYPPGNYRGVSAPNADTLYSLVWLDLEKEPVVFSHPDMGDRFYLFPMYSLWMPVVDSPGTRTQGGKAASYLLTRDTWKGSVPAGMKQIKFPTRYMLILGRTYSTGSDQDYAEVNKLQSEYKAVPLSVYGKPYAAPVAPVVDAGFSMTDKPQDVINALSLDRYFTWMATLMKSDAPPTAADKKIVQKMAKIGIVPGQEFKLANLSAEAQEALKDVVKASNDRILKQKEKGGTLKNGWMIPAAAGTYGTDYLQRALIAAFGWPANLSNDAIYPYASVDRSGEKLNGKDQYTLTFPKGKMPPVDGFWSITMYIEDQGLWFNPNPLNKFTVSLRDKPTYNADGSLTLYFQNQSPGADKEANWLPAPKGDFTLMMRMYWPKTKGASILPPGKGTWAPPGLEKVSKAVE